MQAAIHSVSQRPYVSYPFGAKTGAVRPKTGNLRSKAGQWLENNAVHDIPVSLEDAWALWEDRELIPNWMPWIKSVKVLEADSRMSRWTLATHQFGRDWEFSWLAQNMAPMKYQKIHWRSVPGSSGGSLGSGIEIANRGQIRFARKSPASCTVKLTISYEVPSVLAPFANLLTPLVENILMADMEKFAHYAVNHVGAQK